MWRAGSAPLAAAFSPATQGAQPSAPAIKPSPAFSPAQLQAAPTTGWLTNGGNLDTGDNPGSEFTDVLPAGLQLVGAMVVSGGGVVTLMTLHNAKGLEFPVVFLAGCEENLFPLARAIESPREYEEERRLFYVGLTRAKDRVWLSYAHERYRWGQSTVAGPSPFLAELPEDLVQWEEEPLSRWGGWHGRRTSFGFGGGGDGEPARAATWDDTVAVDAPPGDSVDGEETSDLAPAYRPGERVAHREFGPGTIKAVSGAGRDLKVTVRFDRAGEKRLVARFAQPRRRSCSR